MPEGYNYRATQAINVEGVRAYNPGDLVPDENVSKYGYDTDGLVERIDEQPAADTSDQAAQPVGQPADEAQAEPQG